MTQQEKNFLPFSAFILAKGYDIHFKVAVGFFVLGLQERNT